MRGPYLLGAAFLTTGLGLLGQLPSVSASQLASSSALQPLGATAASHPGFLANPSLAFLLLTVGLAGIGLEVLHPGSLLPGSVGLVAAVLAVIGLISLSVSPIGLLLIAVAVGLFVLDICLSGLGILTVAGVAALIAGGFLLFPGSNGTGSAAPLAVIAVPTVVGAAWFGVSRKALRVRALPVATSTHELLGAIGAVRSRVAPVGSAMVEGELWRVSSYHNEVLEPGSAVRVLAEDGLTLIVEPADERQSESVPSPSADLPPVTASNA